MKAGTSNAQKCFPVHEIRMLLSIDLVDTLLAFHAITGCVRYKAWPSLTHATKHESLLCISRTQYTLPSISDTATVHIMRSHYQINQLSGTKHTRRVLIFLQ